MNQLENKRILLGVTGGIAAYKSAELVRELRRAGAQVRVVMTAGATRFITPLTLQALTGHPVRSELFDAEAEAAMDHIELARWADAVVVAPASASFMARLAHGLADDLLSTVCLATAASVAVAPAMNRLMWDNPATQANRDALASRGVHVFGPDVGEQACGDYGPGRLLEPARVVEALAGLFAAGALQGLNVLVTAGPTVEDIDPVRFLSNRSSGKMGFAVARAAAEAGASVTLVSGPVNQPTPARVARVDVRSAEQMRGEVLERVSACDIFVAAAAVADYRPARRALRKLKRTGIPEPLELELTPDILAEVAARPNRPYCVGFAAETEDLEANAQVKLRNKGLDMVAANRVGQSGSGFDSDDNALTVLWDGGCAELALTNKDALARQLVVLIAERYDAAHPSQDT